MLSYRRCLQISLATTLLIAVAALIWSPLNQDEGWYLLSARHTAEGHLPYRDYAFTQGPVFPYVYSLAQPLIRSFGLLGGRLFTLLLGCGSIGLTAWTAYRTGRRDDPRLPLVITLVCLGLNPFHLQYLSTVKSYALASLFLVCGLGAALRVFRGGGPLWAIASGLSLALAAGTRLSLLVFIPAVGLEYILRRHDLSRKVWGGFCVATLLTLGVIFLPFLILAPEGLCFGLWDYHAARDVGSPLLLKAAFLSRLVRAWLPPLALGLLLCLRRHAWQPGVPAMLGGVLTASLIHCLSPFPYDDYQVPLLPAVVLILALQLPAVCVGPESRQRLAATFTLFGLFFAIGSTQWQDWSSAGRDRLWWPTLERPALFTLQQAAQRIEALDPDGTTLFTPDAYLAIETNRSVPLSLNMGPFGFAPTMASDKAQRLQLLNTDLLLEALTSNPSPVLALSGYAFALEAPELTPTSPEELAKIYSLIEAQYQPAESLSQFGQAHTTLTLWILKSNSTDTPAGVSSALP